MNGPRGQTMRGRHSSRRSSQVPETPMQARQRRLCELYDEAAAKGAGLSENEKEMWNKAEDRACNASSIWYPS